MIGSTLGNRYKIIKLIGSGGMAKVFLGQDLKLDRPIAVKVLHQHMQGNAEILERFHLEAQAVSKLDHPNIVKIYDYSGKGNQQTWLVTEYISGKNLSEFLNSNHLLKLPAPVAVSVIIELCKAVQAAHDESIIHRDIKPENLMITEDGSLKLMDFGIAKRIQRAGLTQVGTFMGSPSYMSPEQIKGQHIDQRSDIFSLSIVFYELLSGHLPFKGNTAHEVANQILSGKFKPLQEHLSSTDAKLESIIIKGLSNRPENRFANVRQLTAALTTYSANANFENSKLSLERFVYKTKKRALERLELEKEEEKQLKIANVIAMKSQESRSVTTAVSGDEIQVDDYYTDSKASADKWNPEYELETDKKLGLNLPSNRPSPRRKPSRKGTAQKRPAPGSNNSASTSQNLWALIIGLTIVLGTLLAQQIYQKMDENSTSAKTNIAKPPTKNLPPLVIMPQKPKQEKKPRVRQFELIRIQSPELKKKTRVEIPTPAEKAPRKSLPAPKFHHVAATTDLIIESKTRGSRISLASVKNPSEKSSWVNSRTIQKVPLKPGKYLIQIEKGKSSMKKVIEIRKGQATMRLIVDF